MFAKHLRSFWLIDSLAIGVDRMKGNFGPMQKKGRKGGALERRELTVVVTAEVDCFRSADQLELLHSWTQGRLSVPSGETSYKPTSGPEQLPGCLP